MRMIETVSQEYPDVKFHYCNAIEAMRRAEGLNAQYPSFMVSMKRDEGHNSAELLVQSQNPIFGSQPFFAYKTVTGQYIWDNFDFGLDGKTWSYVFDDKTVNPDVVGSIGIAANTSDGKTEIVKINMHNGIIRKLNKDGQKTLEEKEYDLMYEG